MILHVSFNAEDARQANHPRQRRDGKEKKGQEAKADSTIRFESAMIDAGPMLLPPKLAAVTLSGTKTHQQRRVTNLDSEARMKKQKNAQPMRHGKRGAGGWLHQPDTKE